MLPARVARVSALRGTTSAFRLLPVVQQRFFWPKSMSDPSEYEKRYPSSDYPSLTDKEDPGMNGGYVNPPLVPRQFRDPYADWWDPEERRNFGEPVHEENDIIGILSPHLYTWTTTGKGLLQIGTFIATFLGLCGCVYYTYPDRVSYPKEYENGLQRELGGPGAMRARRPGDPDPF
ncbi:nadh:ubiquinone oxidoreductase subunit [Zalerion maritima]|uniref:Nadh:ubiquinone oxidoreductase subunit n=1 Tax=Zalerion maritima TaxID=339359 RepID=A0AAD5WWK9_9PEZI|nr:nadh:ubiquinone oxidoreductase subunit [Zalerion maritima]